MTDTAPAPSRKLYWAGWVLSLLPVPLFLMGATMMLSQSEQAVEGLEKYGFPPSVLLGLGITELACTLLYVFPQTAVLGAILLTGYLGGAVCTHVRAGEPFFMPIIVGVFIWLGLLLRDARLRELLPLTR